VLPRWRVAILVQGCFWHRHEGCRYATKPATRPEFWEEKFAGNVVRDRRNQIALLEAGWRLALVWECAIRASGAGEIVRQLAAWMQAERHEVRREWPSLDAHFPNI
jgi:DNA mismatch endonuclease (patch repair protein)